MPSLSAWPRPRTPLGLHQHANVGSYRIPKQFGEYLEKRGLNSGNPWFTYLRETLKMGLHKVISEAGYGSLDYIAAVFNAGIMPVVRFQPDGGGSFTGMGLDRKVIQTLVEAGAVYFEEGNEPDNIGEWDGSQGQGGLARGWDRIRALVDQFMHNANEIIAGGGIALIPAMNAGYASFDRTGQLTDDGADRVSYGNFLEAIRRNPSYYTQVLAWAENARIATAVHNRPSNHPLDYPDDPTSYTDKFYFQNQPGWDNRGLTRLQADSTCFRSYELMDDLNIRFLGFSLPMIGTEAGYTIEVQEDSRFPKLKDGATPDVAFEAPDQDFSSMLRYDEENRITRLDQDRFWSHGAMNLEIIKRFYNGKNRPALFGQCFYHAIGDGGGDSTSEGWYGNPLLGRDLDIIKTFEGYTLAASDPHPSEIPPKPPQPIPSGPQVPTLPKVPTMSQLTRKAGIHLPSDDILTDEDKQQILDINPSIFTVTSQDWGVVHWLRDNFPGCTILGRFYGNSEHSAWDFPWDDPNWFYGYGQFCAKESYKVGIDICQWANEPQLETSKLNYKPEGYAKLAAAASRWLDGWLSAPELQFLDFKTRPGTVPLSPGNHEDDDPDNEGYRGGKILLPTYNRYKAANGVLLLHNYWNEVEGSPLDENFGFRHVKQRFVYEWDSDWMISECNEQHGQVPGDRERQAEAQHLKRWISALPLDSSKCLGFTWFLLRSKDEAFKPEWLCLNEWDRQVMKEYNSSSKDVTMPNYTPVPLSVVEIGIAVAGQSTRFVVQGKPGSVVQGQTVYPRGENDVALATDKLFFGQVNEAGQYVFDVEIPVAILQGQPSASFSIHLSELAFDVASTNPEGFNSVDVPVTAYASAPEAPPPGPNPEQPGPTPDLSSDVANKLVLALVHTFANAGDMFNAASTISKAALNTQNWVQYAKGEIEAPPPDFR